MSGVGVITVGGVAGFDVPVANPRAPHLDAVNTPSRSAPRTDQQIAPRVTVAPSVQVGFVSGKESPATTSWYSHV